MTRLLRTALLSLAATFFLAAPAHAGTFEVPACDAADGNVNHSWDFENTNPSGLQRLPNCPTPEDSSGLLARTILASQGSTVTPVGGYAQWSFNAPSGLTITQLRLRRWLGMEAGSGWRLYGQTGDDVTIPGETCTAGSGTDECNLGGVGSSEITRAVSTTRLSYGFVCTAGATGGGTSCDTGYTIHWARAAIYSARITLSDPTPPTVTAPTGTLVTEAGFHQGTEAVTFSGSDATGLKALRVYVDGDLHASTPRACDYSYTLPCNYPGRPADPAGSTLSVDTTTLADGPHTVEPAVIDAAGNETRAAARSIVVDNTGPSLAWLTADPRADSAPTLSASFTPLSGQVAPVTEARWKLCPAGTQTSCTTGTLATDNAGGRLDALAIPAQGDWELGLQLVDAAGQIGPVELLRARYAVPGAQPAPTATPIPRPAAAPTPAVVPTPTPVPGGELPVARRASRVTLTAARLTATRLTVRGTLTRATSGRLTLRYRARDAGRTRLLERVLRVRSGRFAATLTLPKSLRGTARGTVELRFAGDPDNTPSTLRRTRAGLGGWCFLTSPPSASGEQAFPEVKSQAVVARRAGEGLYGARLVEDVSH